MAVVAKTPPAALVAAPLGLGVVYDEIWEGDTTVTMVDDTATPGLVVGMVTEFAKV